MLATKQLSNQFLHWLKHLFKLFWEREGGGCGLVNFLLFFIAAVEMLILCSEELGVKRRWLEISLYVHFCLERYKNSLGGGEGTERKTEHLSSCRNGVFKKAPICSGCVGGISRPGPLFGGK